MQPALCRILVFLFTVNCILPAPSLQAKAAPKDWKQDVAQTIEEQADFNAEQEAWLLYAYASDPSDIANAVERLHAVYERRSQRQAQPTPDACTHPCVSTYTAKTAALTPGQSQVLSLLARNALSFEDLIDFIDPLDPQDNHLIETVYAAEVIGNSAETYAQLPIQELEYTLEWMPRVQQRILYRLNTLKENTQTRSTPYGIKALGTLRIALWKIHSFYEQTGQTDPLFTPADRTAALPEKPVPADDARSFIPRHQADNTRINIPARRLPASFRKADVYDLIMLDFINELAALKNKKPSGFRILAAVKPYPLRRFIHARL